MGGTALISSAQRRADARHSAEPAEFYANEFRFKYRLLDNLKRFAYSTGSLSLSAEEIEWPELSYSMLASETGRAEVQNWLSVFRHAFSGLDFIDSASTSELNADEWKELSEGIDLALDGLQTRMAALARGKVFDEA